MKKSTRYIILGALVVIFVGLFVWYEASPGKYDDLANYLTQSGVKMYGAFWCPHCQATKQAFGKSAKKLAYVECSTHEQLANGSYVPTQICTDEKIQSYPTWDFPGAIYLSSGTNDSNTVCKFPYEASDASQPLPCAGAKSAGYYLLTVNNRTFLTPASATLQNGTWTLPAHSRISGELTPDEIGTYAAYKVK